MSIEQELDRRDEVQKYIALKTEINGVVTEAQRWETQSIALTAELTDPVEIAEVASLRADLVAQLRAVFGL